MEKIDKRKIDNNFIIKRDRNKIWLKMLDTSKNLCIGYSYSASIPRSF